MPHGFPDYASQVKQPTEPGRLPRDEEEFESLLFNRATGPKIAVFFTRCLHRSVTDHPCDTPTPKDHVVPLGRRSVGGEQTPFVDIGRRLADDRPVEAIRNSHSNSGQGLVTVH